MAKRNGRSIQYMIENKMFSHVFQPIYDLQEWEIFGYEALIRTNQFPNAESFILLARQLNYLYLLDTASIQLAIESIKMYNIKLFINIFPSTLVHPLFSPFLEMLNSSVPIKQNIVFEINESEKIFDYRLFKKSVEQLKELNYLVALDDFGKNDSRPDKILDLEPNFVKLDKSLANQLKKKEGNQKIIEKILVHCESKKSKVVLEGIEREEDLAAAKALGVHFGQGYLLGEPVLLKEIYN